MARNSYLQIGRLSTHPAFSVAAAGLVCPLRDAEPFARVAEFKTHFLAHEPDAAAAWRWLSGRCWEREQPRRGWPTSAAMLEADRCRDYGDHPAFDPESAELACPYCPERFGWLSSFEPHLLGHAELDAQTAARQLSPERYERERTSPSWRNGVRFEERRAWPARNAALADPS